MISNLLDIDFIHGDIYGQLYMKLQFIILRWESVIQGMLFIRKL